ncbi:hypothetical protein ACT29H_11725 [Thermophagus sp. OGC60D27]|uniref:hypothetical protein n=1 Tax=Thermophagus sp. OGC60D27 TaxID=3458415 RepID=UPI004038007D
MKKLLFSLAFGTAIMFVSCENEEVIPASDFATANFNVTTESVVTTDAAIEDVVEAADYEVELYTGTVVMLEDLSVASQTNDQLKSASSERFRDRYRLGRPDVTVEWTEGDYPRTVTLDYGEETELANGRIISGVIEIEISAPLFQEGAVRTVSFIDFSVDSLIINGTIEKTIVSVTDEREVSIVRDLIVALPDGTEVECYAEITRTWEEGLGTQFYHGDDVIGINGFATCTDSDGNEYRREITEKLQKQGGCRFLVSGEVTFSNNGEVFGTVNYGDGTCDNVGEYTTADGTKEFTIGKRIRKRINQNQSGE